MKSSSGSRFKPSDPNENAATTVRHYWHKSGAMGVIVRAALRTLQLVFAATVAALYGADLQRATQDSTSASASWIYAEVAAALSILTCAAHCFFTVKRVAWVMWDFVLCVLWTAQFGVFASIYVESSAKKDAEYDATGSVERMKAGVWIDLINVFLWFTTFVLGIAWCCTARGLTRNTDIPVLLENGYDLQRREENEAKKGSIDLVKRSEDSEPRKPGQEENKERTDSLPSYRQSIKD